MRELARQLRVNPATVSKAYQRLSDGGVLEVQRGEGTFVAHLSSKVLAAERLRLLEGGARRYARLAVALGAARAEASRVLERAWQTPDDEAEVEQ